MPADEQIVPALTLQNPFRQFYGDVSRWSPQPKTSSTFNRLYGLWLFQNLVPISPNCPPAFGNPHTVCKLDHANDATSRKIAEGLVCRWPVHVFG